MIGDFITCETTAAITLHLRRLGDSESPINYSGHHPRPSSLCGAEIAWDTKIPVVAARCRACLNAVACE